MRRYYPTFDDDYEIVKKFDKTVEYNAFYHKPDFFTFKGHLYFTTSGTADSVVFYYQPGQVLEVAQNTSLGYAGLTIHRNGESENIVFLDSSEYEEADLDDKSMRQIRDHLLQWDM